MFFLFGWGHRTFNERGPTVPANCPNCSNETWLHMISYKTWFTLFFIPVIPYESKNLLLCPVCSQGLELQGEQVEQAKHLNGKATAFLAEEISETEFQAAAQGMKLLG
mgnify:CR=1 FL=1